MHGAYKSTISKTLSLSATSKIPDLTSHVIVALLALFSLHVAFITDANAQGGTVVEIAGGVLDHDRIDGPRWTSATVDPSLSGQHTIRVSWGGDADIRFSLFQVIDSPPQNNRVRIATTSGTGSPAQWTGNLEVSEQYFIGIWSASGSASFNATIQTPPTALINAGQGTLDSEDVVGAQWVRLNFDSLAAAAHTITVSWNSNADVQFRVLEANGTRISNVNRGANPGTWTGVLDADTQYYISIWSEEGIADYTAIIEAKVPLSIVPLSITEQPMSLVVPVGDDAIFSVDAIGSGNISYQWFADGSLLPGETTDALTVSAVSDAADGTEYSVEVDNGSETIVSTPAILRIGEPLVLDQVIDYGIADFEAVLGQRHNIVQFSPQETGHLTIKLEWEGSENIDMAVFNAETGKRLAINTSTTGSPKSFTLFLVANTQYRATFWITGGFAEWVMRKIQTVKDPDADISDSPDAASRPNIVLINTDDQRTSTLDFLPAIQQHLIAKGVSYTNTIVPTPSCCPSRATTLSGQYVHNNGQFQQQRQNDAILEKTVQKYLQQAGYYTGHAGKYLHWVGTQDPVPPYWDRWTYIKGGFYDIDMNLDGIYLKPGGYTTDIVFERTKDYLRDFEARNDDNPWFVYIAPMSPHSPYTAEYDFRDAQVPQLAGNSPAFLEADISDKPSFFQFRMMDEATAQDIHQQRARNLLSVDREVDQLIEYLEASGELDNTLIIFTSDNGYLLAEHQTFGKFTPYRDSVQVPMVISWPGFVAEDTVNESFVSHVDIAPTILEAAGVNTNALELDGRNIFNESRDVFYMEYFLDREANGGRIGDWASLRTNTYQYTEWYDLNGSGEVVFREYYDMVSDPYQLENLYQNGDSADDPDFTDLSVQLTNARMCSGAECP